MPAPVLITSPSPFARGPLAGLGAQEVNFDPVTITASRGAASSHQSDTGTSILPGGYEGHSADSGYTATHTASLLSPSSPNFLGVGLTAAGVVSMVAGAVAFGMGHKVLGGILGVVGLAAAVTPAVMGRAPFSGAPILITPGQGMV